MANLSKNSQLNLSSDGDILLDLACGYGQPVHTIIYRVGADGRATPVKEFNGDVKGLKLGRASEWINNTIRIFSTIDDRQDPIPGQPAEDIYLKDRVYCGSAFAEYPFIHSTHGTGERVTCTFEVSIL